MEPLPYEPPLDQAPEIARINRLANSSFGLLDGFGLQTIPSSAEEAGKLPTDEPAR